MGINVGIDLGTTYSAVAQFTSGKGVSVLKNDIGEKYTPSVVCIEDGRITVGQEAKDEHAAGNTNTAAFYKSMMGEENYSIYLDGGEYTPEDLSAIFLRELKEKIEGENGVTVDGAVITVPAYFNEAQRNATMNAGKRAGLNVLEIINEPTAAIIAYGLTGGARKNVLVYDLGGGTFDVTIAQINGTSVNILSTNGNHQLGGKNWDHEIVKELIDRFREEYGIDINEYPEDFKKLQVTAEDVKKRLTRTPVTTANVSCEGYVGRYEITRELFDLRTSDLLNTTAILIGQCFDEIGGGFGWNSLDEVVLVGGSTRMPQVREYVMREYGRPPVTKNIDVDTIVAAGAAIKAQLCVEKKITHNGLIMLEDDIKDITSHSLGILVYNNDKEAFENSILIPKNSDYNKYFSKDYYVSKGNVKIYVLQGESENPSDNSLLCRYEIDCNGVSGQTKVAVGLCYNNSGVVEVRAQTEDGTVMSVSRVDDVGTLDAIMDELRKEIDTSRSPYSKWAGISNIPTTERDRFGNPEGAQYDLALDGSFKGYKILILNLCEVASMRKAIEAMQKKGFEVELIEGPVPSAHILKKKLEDKCQLWFISQMDLRFDENHYRVMQEFFDEGHGLYVWGDNDPLNTDANFIIQRMFGITMGGDYYAREVLSIQTAPGEPGIVPNHLISTGMVSFFEGDSIASIKIGGGLEPLIYSSDRNIVTAYYDHDGKRALIDGAFTRLWDGDWGTCAGTERYIVNAAVWLANIERHGYKPSLKIK